MPTCSADFFDVESHRWITFNGTFTERTGDTHFKASAELTIRGTTRPVAMDVAYLGQWESPFWVGDENRGSIRRIGFEARTTINRQDFGVSWQDNLPRGGVVVSNQIDLALDVEAIHLGDLESTGAISYYRPAQIHPARARPGAPPPAPPEAEPLTRPWRALAAPVARG